MALTQIRTELCKERGVLTLELSYAPVQTAEDGRAERGPKGGPLGSAEDDMKMRADLCDSTLRMS